MLGNHNLLEIDNSHIWHPYSAMHSDIPVYPVASAQGVRIKLSDGRQLIDGMASWWCAIHGYNHPVLNTAITTQLKDMAHVMFGGFTHQPAVKLVEKLVEITPTPLTSVFLADSGSVSVEVAMKMAIQYWHAKSRPSKHRFLSLRNGYHGDTMGAMSVCDPVTGMHSLFSGVLAQQLFVDSPSCGFGNRARGEDIEILESMLKRHHRELAALILEPIVQGAGGMRFYSADYLTSARALCDQYEVLLIADEIATGFGRSGKLFACEHALISPDIMCIGKSLTGGYMSLAATLATELVSSTIDQGNPGVFMHGPTFMANPLACAVSLASINLLLESNWPTDVHRINHGLEKGLAPSRDFDQVSEVRTLGAIGVVELKTAVDMKSITSQFVDAGVWVRPFGKLVYLMPAFVMNDEDLATLCDAIIKIVQNLPK
ncbi:MAG: adenosylmethionine--8-amino-7-oxononanoate transaminase [Gammaproteobacteria bacterium]|nr:adenosylmethionine--8-amino-7-oxononanoate transaminase [Gammaproteobacteria bacterium]